MAFYRVKIWQTIRRRRHLPRKSGFKFPNLPGSKLLAALLNSARVLLRKPLPSKEFRSMVTFTNPFTAGNTNIRTLFACIVVTHSFVPLSFFVYGCCSSIWLCALREFLVWLFLSSFDLVFVLFFFGFWHCNWYPL